LDALAEMLHGLAGSAVEDIGQTHAEQDHGAYDDGGLQFADDSRQEGYHQKLNYQRTSETMKHIRPESEAFQMCEFVGAEFVQALIRRFFAQALKRCSECFRRLLDGKVA